MILGQYDNPTPEEIKNSLDQKPLEIIDDKTDILPEIELLPNNEKPSNDEIENKLDLALREFEKSLSAQGIKPLAWFIFGSFIKGDFAKNSDIDVGFILNEEDSQSYNQIPLYENFDIIRTCIAGHKISPTAFDILWLTRHGISVDALKQNGTFPPTYAPIKLLNLSDRS